MKPIDACLNYLVVHVGLGQAGSTTLQKHIFNQVDFGFALLTPYEKRFQTVRKYIELPLPGDFDTSACRSFFVQQYKAFNDSNLIPVISNEGLTGQNFLRMDRNLETELYARRILEAFGWAKIFIILREQRSLLLSKYRKLIERFEGTVALKDFIRWREHGPRVQMDSDSVYLGSLEYDKPIRMYASYFGKSNVLALPMEMMEKDPVEFLQRINAFCGSNVPDTFPIPRTNVNGVGATSKFYRYYNLLYSPNSVSLLWFLNPRATRGVSWTRNNTIIGRLSDRARSGLVRAARTFTHMDLTITQERAAQLEEIDRLVGSYFGESNRRLMEMTRIDFGKYGFRL